MKRMGKSTDRLAWLMPGRRIRSRGIWAPLSTAKIPLSCLACPGSAGWSTKRKPRFGDVKSVKRLKSDLLPNVVVNGFRRGQKFDSHFVLMRKKKSRVTSVCPTARPPKVQESRVRRNPTLFLYWGFNLSDKQGKCSSCCPDDVIVLKTYHKIFQFQFFSF